MSANPNTARLAVNYAGLKPDQVAVLVTVFQALQRLSADAVVRKLMKLVVVDEAPKEHQAVICRFLRPTMPQNQIADLLELDPSSISKYEMVREFNRLSREERVGSPLRGSLEDGHIEAWATE